MLTKNEITQICIQYGIVVAEIGEMIESSRGEEDKRFHYPINQQYMLKISNSSFIKEENLLNIARLIKRYREIGVYCPELLQNRNENYLYIIEHNGEKYGCYIEEYTHYKTADSVMEQFYQIKKDMMWHLGKMAFLYTNVDLAETKSMWSIIELSPMDVEIDEKQENFNTLVECLKQNGYITLAMRLEQFNQELRNEIKTYLKELPRCVYQGDLNSSNVLLDEHNRFVGVIDFNMYGTEVNINCFLNETMYFLKQEDFEKLNADEILMKMTHKQQGLLEEIFQHYTLSHIEKQCFSSYKKIVYLSFYPNVMLWIQMIKQKLQMNKVVELLNLIVEMETA